MSVAADDSSLKAAPATESSMQTANRLMMSLPLPLYMINCITRLYKI